MFSDSGPLSNRRTAWPDAFAGDPEWMARFERAAKLMALLNHTNIVLLKAAIIQKTMG